MSTGWSAGTEGVPTVKSFRCACVNETITVYPFVVAVLTKTSALDADLNTRLGRYVSKSYGDEMVRAFIPPPLPPNPEVRLAGLQKVLE